MGMEEWPQVEPLESGIIQSNHKDSSKTKRVTFLKREVMPYAKRKEKSPVYGRPAARRVLRYAADIWRTVCQKQSRRSIQRPDGTGPKPGQHHAGIQEHQIQHSINKEEEE